MSILAVLRGETLVATASKRWAEDACEGVAARGFEGFKLEREPALAAAE